jgi:hypothetical protein
VDKNTRNHANSTVPETPNWRKADTKVNGAGGAWWALLWEGKVHYNPEVWSQIRCGRPTIASILRLLGIVVMAAGVCRAQQAPAASGARMLLLPRKLVIGERATLAVLDVNGRLTPGVNVAFSYGEKVTTDTTGRARFVAPLNPGTVYAEIEGRSGRVSSNIVTPAEIPSATEEVTAAPRVATLSDRFELQGHGFCGDADANHVTIGGMAALVLASSPGNLIVLPPTEVDPGPARMQVECGQKMSEAFTVVFVNLELVASNGAMAPGEHRSLVVRVKGSTAKINLEARNLAAHVADLVGGGIVRATSSGGAENLAKFELVGKTGGNFTISIRLVAPLVAPRL